MRARDFVAILTAVLITMGILINAIFLWLGFIFIVLLLGAYFL